MADPQQSPPPPAAGSDLHARIQARVAARRDASRHRTGPGMPAQNSTEAAVSAPHLAAARTDNPRAAEQTAVPAATQLSVADLRSGLSGDRPEAARSAGRRRHGQVPSASRNRHIPGFLRRIGRFGILLLLTAVAVVGLRTYVIASYYIPSASMETTLHGCPTCQPDMVLVDKLSYRFKPVSRTDVVVFDRPPLAPPQDKELIKRVIGLPGDTVSGHGGHVFIDNKELVEPYLNPACDGTADFAAVKVPAGRYFMMGDNRCNSFDSRMFGTIPRGAVVGRAFAVIWPGKHLRWL